MSIICEGKMHQRLEGPTRTWPDVSYQGICLLLGSNTQILTSSTELDRRTSGEVVSEVLLDDFVRWADKHPPLAVVNAWSNPSP